METEKKDKQKEKDTRWTTTMEKEFIDKLGSCRPKTHFVSRLDLFNLLTNYLAALKNRTFPKNVNVKKVRQHAEKRLTTVRMGLEVKS